LKREHPVHLNLLRELYIHTPFFMPTCWITLPMAMLCVCLSQTAGSRAPRLASAGPVLGQRALPPAPRDEAAAPEHLGVGKDGMCWQTMASESLRLRGGGPSIKGTRSSPGLPPEPRLDAPADIPGDVPGEGESAADGGGAGANEPPSSSASEVSAIDTMSSGVNDEGHRVWGARKVTIDQMEKLGSGREVWKGLYWANTEQKRCELTPLATDADRAAGIRPRSLLWEEDCAEATMDAPPGYFRPYGDAIPLNDTWIGGFPDGSPVLLRDVCCGGGDTSLVLGMYACIFKPIIKTQNNR